MVRPEARAKESNHQKVDFDSAESLLDPSIAPDSVFDFIMAQHQRLLHPEHPLTRFSYRYNGPVEQRVACLDPSRRKGSSAFKCKVHIGVSTANQNTQELLIIASVSTVLFQIIRDELLHDGIPLGLATSALSFSRLCYFWSPAFWGGTTSLVNLKKWRGVRVLGLITLGGFIAITAGPASAVLMLPRPTVSTNNVINALQVQTNETNQNWHDFTTKFWLNGTADVYWPTKLTSDHTGGPHCTGLEGMNTMNQPQCINKGLPFL